MVFGEAHPGHLGSGGGQSGDHAGVEGGGNQVCAALQFTGNTSTTTFASFAALLRRLVRIVVSPLMKPQSPMCLNLLSLGQNPFCGILPWQSATVIYLLTDI